MQLLFITSWWPSRVHPYHGNFVQKHVRLLAREHEAVVVAVQEDPSLGAGRQELVVVSEGDYRVVQVYYGRPKRMPRPLVLAMRARAYLTGLRTVLQTLSFRPDLIHAHVLVDAGIISYGLSRLLHVPFLVSEHSTRYGDPGSLRYFDSMLGRAACRKAAYILPVTDYLRREMQQCGFQGCYRVIGNVVNTDLFTANKLEVPSRNSLHLLHISNLQEQQKNVQGLLRAFSQYRKGTTSSATLTIASEGNLATVRAYMNTLNLDDGAVRLSGPHREEEIATLMRSHDALILFSHFETQGIVLLEAQACGLPVIATAVGGVLESVAPSGGILVAAGDEAALVEAINVLATGLFSYDASRARTFVVKRWGEAAIREQFTAVYHQAIAKAAERPRT